jgi:hypothetical protein
MEVFSAAVPKLETLDSAQQLKTQILFVPSMGFPVYPAEQGYIIHTRDQSLLRIQSKSPFAIVACHKQH